MKLFIFDIDGVLNKSEMFSLQYQKLSGVDYNELLPFFKGDFQKALMGEADLKEIIVPWLPKWNWQGDVDSFLELWFQLENSIDLEMIELLVALKNKNYKLVAATNQEKHRGEFLRNRMGFSKFFQKVYLSAELGMKKSDPDFFKKIAREFNCELSDMALIDDDQENIETASELTLETHLFTSNQEFSSYISKYL